MKDLKSSIGNDLATGFMEINQLFHAYKFYIENLNGKSKEESIEEFLENQMILIESLVSSHLRKTAKNLIKSTFDWRNKSKEAEE